MGASVMAVASRPLQGSDNDQEFCEGKALPVPLGKALETDLKSKKKVKAALFAVFTLGLNYRDQEKNACGDDGTLLDATALKAILTTAYQTIIDGTDLNAAKWKTLVLHSHILGQLTRYFWRKREKPEDKLSVRHLLKAWIKFDTATSSEACKRWLCNSGDPNSRKAYILPKPEGEAGALQIGEPCILCAADQ